MDMLQMQNSASSPLADRMRPRTLEEFIGQEHIVGPGRLLRRAIEANRLTSCIFYGPPGTGKTSLAHVISECCNARFAQLNAVTAGVAEVREIIREASEELSFYGRPTYLLLDECHRWSKAQSDSILPAMEKGTIRLIGSTTENPYIAMTPAILSRCRIFEFKRLRTEDLKRALLVALSDKQRGYGNLNVSVTDDALDHLCRMAGGDARSAYNALELAVLTTRPDANGKIVIDLAAAEESIQQKVIQCDESTFYDMLSAFCKSLRGSDVDAALFWACRMLRAGVDPRIVARRLTVHASEDVGLADPMALLQAQAALTSVEKIGMPECLLNLCQAIAYVCTAPKSNSALAIHEIYAAAAETAEVPPHLRDTHYSGHDKLGSGEGYLYPHEFPNHYVQQDYLPESLRGSHFFKLSDQGFEATLQARMQRIKETKENGGNTNDGNL